MNAATKIAREVGAERVAQHAETQRAKGLVRVAVWVPAAEKDRLIAYAARLRVGAEILLPSDRRVAALLRYGIDPSLQESGTPPSATRGDERPQRKRKRRSKPPSDAKPAKKDKQKQSQPKTPKKRRNQRRREAQKAARSKK